MTSNLISRIGAILVTPSRFFDFWLVVAAVFLALTSCSDDLDVQQS